jgi:WD40 repeat protein
MILGYENRHAHKGIQPSSSTMPRIFAGCATWDPHSSALAAVAFHHTLQIVNTRNDMEVVHSIPFAHRGTIRDIDYNPNKPHTLVTCGDDRNVKIWDSRKLEQQLKTLMGHSHWVWSTRYNPFHDQLILRFV